MSDNLNAGNGGGGNTRRGNNGGGGENGSNGENSGGQSTAPQMPESFQFMTEFSLNMEIFNQTLLPVMMLLLVTAAEHHAVINDYLKPTVSEQRSRIFALEDRATRLEAARVYAIALKSADNQAFATPDRTEPQ